MEKRVYALVVICLMLCLMGCSSPEEKAMKVADEFFKDFYDANPKSIELFDIKNETEESFAISIEKIKKGLKDKYGDTLSEKFMKKQFWGTQLVLTSPQTAESQNANISLFEINLKRVNESEKDYYFTFEGKVKIDYLDSEKEDVFPYIKGQIRITQEDGKYKVHGIRYFNDGVIKYRYH